MMSGICFKRFQKGRKGCWVGTVEQDWPNVGTFLPLGAGHTAVPCTIVSAFSAGIFIMKS